MPQNRTPKPKGVMLTSTACILAALTFFAGLLVGSLLTSHWGSDFAAQTSSMRAPVAQAPAGQTQPHPEDQESHIAEARSTAEQHPDDAEAWIHLGNLYFDADRPAEAIPAYENALRIEPGNADVRTDLGTMYRAAGNPEKALECYNAVIESQPDHQNAYFNKGVTLMMDLARPADAVAAWKVLLAKFPKATLSDGTPLADVLPDLATDAAVRLERAGKPEAALAAYDQALAERPDFQPALAHKAALLETLGRKAEASGLWERLLQINPDAVAPDGTPVKDLTGAAAS